MATARLDERQKQEMADRYSAGESSAALADVYGCSANTVTRTVRAVIGDVAFEQLKQQRGRSTPMPVQAVAPVQATLPMIEQELQEEQEPQEEEPEEPALEPSTGLALEDADDFADDLDGDAEEDQDDDGPELVLPLLPQPLTAGERTVSRPLPLAQLPASLYLLVDKEVELRGTRLTDFSELSPLAPEEEQHQAMVMFANPRNAKRQAGRSQRVIKVPDASLLERTAPYIRAQGITRVVLEGVLYALPGG
ncbi:MAG: helix-turn-helix domain-containing protein [Synechococcus sp.]